MNLDALVLALIAIADMGMIVHLRQRKNRHFRHDRMMGSLRLALYWANRDRRNRESPPSIANAHWEA